MITDLTRHAPVDVVPTRQVERYVRCSIDVIVSKRRDVGSIAAGLQVEPTDVPAVLRTDFRAGIDYVRALARNDDFDQLTSMLEDHITARWPGRAWFVEVWSEDECLTQVYAPYGMPRFR